MWKKALLRGLIRIGVIVIITALTEFLLYALNIPEYILPRPSSVFTVLHSQFNYLIYNTLVTINESILGFLLGNSIAYLFAIFLILNPKVEKEGVSIAIAIKATPIIALAPLFVIWFGNGLMGKVLMAALVCFFPMLINSLTGLRDISKDLKEYLLSLSASKKQILTILRIPASLPYVFAAAKVSSAVSVVGAIVAELSGSDKGIGYILQVSIYQLETDIMFASILLITIFGLLFYYGIGLLENYVLGAKYNRVFEN